MDRKQALTHHPDVGKKNPRNLYMSTCSSTKLPVKYQVFFPDRGGVKAPQEEEEEAEDQNKEKRNENKHDFVDVLMFCHHITVYTYLYLTYGINVVAAVKVCFKQERLYIGYLKVTEVS